MTTALPDFSVNISHKRPVCTLDSTLALSIYGFPLLARLGGFETGDVTTGCAYPYSVDTQRMETLRTMDYGLDMDSLESDIAVD